MNNTKFTIALLLLFCFVSCDVKKVGETTPMPPKGEDKNPVEIAPVETLEPTLDGRWTISRISAFSNQLPTYQPGDVIYEFNSSESKLKVTLKEGLAKNIPSLVPAGEHYWLAEDCLIVIENKTYLYRINSTTSKTSGANISLSLDTNTDPSISPDGAVYILTKIP